MKTASIRGPDSFLLIIGAMKCGTTSVFRILSQHPDIAPSREKEPEYFSDDENYRKGLDWYLDLWDWDSSTHRVAMEASTGYSKSPQRPGVPERIAAVSGRRFRFVYLMRNPFERIESQIRHGLYAGWNPSLDEGLRARDGVIDITRYAAQIDEYMRFFPRESMLLLTLEELKEDPSAVITAICRHVGVSDDVPFTGLRLRSNPGERYEAPKLVNKIEESSSPLARAAKAALSRVAGSRIKFHLWRYVPVKVEIGRYRLTDAERSEIFERLGPDLERLKSVYGVDIQRHWGLDL